MTAGSISRAGPVAWCVECAAGGGWAAGGGGPAGSYTFDAPRDRVSALLMNPAVIASCIPGLQLPESNGKNIMVPAGVALARK